MSVLSIKCLILAAQCLLIGMQVGARKRGEPSWPYAIGVWAALAAILTV